MGEPVKVGLVGPTMSGGLIGMGLGLCGILQERGVKFDPVVGSCRGGARLGLGTLCYTGVRNYLAEKRGVEDAYTTIAAASAGAAAFGLTYKGPPLDRIKLVICGIALGVPFNLLVYKYQGAS